MIRINIACAAGTDLASLREKIKLRMMTVVRGLSENVISFEVEVIPPIVQMQISEAEKRALLE